jgi:hypothetical protein
MQKHATIAPAQKTAFGRLILLFLQRMKFKFKTRRRGADSTNSMEQSFVGALALYKTVRFARRRDNAVLV